MAHNIQRNVQTQIIKGNKEDTYETNKQKVLSYSIATLLWY